MKDEQLTEIALAHGFGPAMLARGDSAVAGNPDQFLPMLRAVAQATAVACQPALSKPIDMLLFCPKCGSQHIDAPEPEKLEPFDSGADIEYIRTPAWTNPPHLSHKCAACRCVWRPADVATNGVASIETKGKADTWLAGPRNHSAQSDNALTFELLDTLQVLVKHFTKTPSTLADSQARGKAHQVIAKAYAQIGYAGPTDPTPVQSEESADAKVPNLAVWYGSMPESNGKSNWTAILHNGDIASGITLDRSEYPDRVRYEADRARWLIGELADEPFILDYDADKHSGYTAPQAAQTGAVATEARLFAQPAIHERPDEAKYFARRLRDMAKTSRSLAKYIFSDEYEPDDKQDTADGLQQDASIYDQCANLIDALSARAPEADLVLTHNRQPDNIGAWKLGDACHKAGHAASGDYIDRGLALLKELQAKGYGVVALTEPQPESGGKA